MVEDKAPSAPGMHRVFDMRAYLLNLRNLAATLGGDLRSPWLLWLKAGLFVAAALLSAALLWSDAPRSRTILLCAVMAWAASRAYFFAFHVLGAYVQLPRQRAGLMDAWRRSTPR